MSDIHIEVRYLIYLLIAVGWTTFFSLFNKPALRGWRNHGILACYVLLVVMFFRVHFLSALVTWCIMGVAGGLAYIAYELFARARAHGSEEKPTVSLTHIVYGFLAWPIMVPEAIEYILTELGILKAWNVPQASQKDESPDA
jgi:hypothetical protein